MGLRARAEQADALAGRLDNQLEQLQVSGEDAAQVNSRLLCYVVMQSYQKPWLCYELTS